MYKLVVTGGAGFIGSYVTERFISMGYQVLVIDNFVTGRRENLDNVKDNSLLEVFESDIRSSEASAEICKFKPNAIVHLAAQMNVRRSVENPCNDAEQNIIGTINLIESAINANCKSFIFSSTGGAIYGEQESFPADESHPTNPECPYGVSKLCAENYLLYFSRNSSLRTASLRFGNVYGHRQNPKGEAGVVSIFVKQLLNNEPLTINGDGTQTRDFIYVSDIVEAINLVCSSHLDLDEAKNSLEIYNLGTGIETSVNDIADMLIKVTRKHIPESKVDRVNKPRASGEQLRSLLDASKFSSKFSWKPKISIQSGLEQAFLDAMKTKI